MRNTEESSKNDTVEGIRKPIIGRWTRLRYSIETLRWERSIGIFLIISSNAAKLTRHNDSLSPASRKSANLEKYYGVTVMVAGNENSEFCIASNACV